MYLFCRVLWIGQGQKPSVLSKPLVYLLFMLQGNWELTSLFWVSGGTAAWQFQATLHKTPRILDPG